MSTLIVDAIVIGVSQRSLDRSYSYENRSPPEWTTLSWATTDGRTIDLGVRSLTNFLDIDKANIISAGSP